MEAYFQQIPLQPTVSFKDVAVTFTWVKWGHVDLAQRTVYREVVLETCSRLVSLVKAVATHHQTQGVAHFRHAWTGPEEKGILPGNFAGFLTEARFGLLGGCLICGFHRHLLAEKRGAGESVETSGPLEAGCPIPAVTVTVHPFAMFVLYCLSLPTTPAPL
uniref:KRAB domain-containing protein n=1 Tax=Bos indicus x Bos taurus TaxID=30522 RepID=A0A4W2CP15_BOBOX